MWCKKLSSEKRASIVSEPVNDSVESLLKTHEELTKRALTLERLVDPLLPERSFVSTTTNIDGHDWVVVDENRSKKSFRPPPSDPLLVGDCPYDGRGTDKYFGLSDREGIIIKFNVAEYRPLDGMRMFTDGIDYPGRRKVKRKPVPVGIEARETYDSVLVKFLQRVCDMIKRIFRRSFIGKR